MIFNKQPKRYDKAHLLYGDQATSTSGYRFGFNGKESDNEIMEVGNTLNFGARIYHSRLGRFLSTDPLQRQYVSLSPYHFVDNSPILNVEADGRYFYAHTKKMERVTKRALRKVFGRKNGFSFDDNGQLQYSGETSLKNKEKEYVLNLFLNEIVNNANQHVHIKEDGLVEGDGAASLYINDEGITTGSSVTVNGVTHTAFQFSGEATVTKNTTSSTGIVTKNTTIFIGSAVDINENGGMTVKPTRNLWHGIGHALTNMAENRDRTTAGSPSLQKKTVGFDNLVSKLTGKKGKAWQPRTGSDHGHISKGTRGVDNYYSNEASSYSQSKSSRGGNIELPKEKMIMGSEKQN